MRSPLFAWWTVTAFALLTATGANCLYVLELVQVVHRGGVAPPPAGTPNRDKLCSPDGTGSCAAIANRGVQQQVDMGAYIAKLYADDEDVVGAKTWMGSEYDATAVYTRSLADTTLVRAATALLKGLYPGQEGDLTPAVVSTPAAGDVLLNVNAFPSFVIENEARAQQINQTLEAAVDGQFPDGGAIGAMGKEVGLGERCTQSANRVWCCDVLHQLATMYSAVDGGGSGAPALMANVERLAAVAGVRARVLYGYSTDDLLGEARGSLGQPLAQELLVGMRGKMLSETDDNYNTRKLMQYAHDVPIHTTIGQQPSDTVPVTETFLVDLLRDEATGAYFVRLRHAAVGGEPEGVPSSVEFPFQCLNAAGEPSGAKGGDGLICPFDDFVRFVDGSRGTSGDGAICHLETSTAESFQCRVAGPPRSPQCARYRKLCPRQACPGYHIYDAVSGDCRFRALKEDVMCISCALGLVISMLFVGVTISVIVLHWCPLACIRTASKNVALG